MSSADRPAFTGVFGQAQFDEAFDHVAARRSPSVLQIGCMDGVSWDPVHAAIKRHNCAALLVEPQPEFAALARAAYADYPQVRVANCAISEHDGVATLHRVPPVHVLDGSVPKWAAGIASLYTDRNALGGLRVGQGAAEAIAAHRSSIEVPCMRLQTLIDQFELRRVDIVVTDVEGGDWMVLRQLNLKRYRPAMVYFEYYNLPEEEKTDILRWLVDNRYRIYVTQDEMNVLAAA
jgi:FkbM family methyltransferase